MKKILSLRLYKLYHNTLTWSDYRDGYFSVTKSIADGEEGRTKTDHERTVPVHPRVQQMLSEHLKVRQLLCDKILVTQHGEGYQPTRAFANRFQKALKKADYEPLSLQLKAWMRV